MNELVLFFRQMQLVMLSQGYDSLCY